MSIRKLTDHKIPGLNEAIEINVLDEPGEGGACHYYDIALLGENRAVRGSWHINFQKGPIATPADYNGLTDEALLAVAIDRIRGFQYAWLEDGSFDFNTPGPSACGQNAAALGYMTCALFALQQRTADRLARGVVGRKEP